MRTVQPGHQCLRQRHTAALIDNGLSVALGWTAFLGGTDSDYGMAIAQDRVYVSLKNGEIVCFGE